MLTQTQMKKERRITPRVIIILILIKSTIVDFSDAFGYDDFADGRIGKHGIVEHGHSAWDAKRFQWTEGEGFASKPFQSFWQTQLGERLATEEGIGRNDAHPIGNIYAFQFLAECEGVPSC